MASQIKTDFDSLVRAMDAETTAIAERIDQLTAKLQQDGLTADDAQSVLTGLQAISSRLKTLGANPADPVPGGVGGDTTTTNASASSTNK